jgi:hypothetical protein
MMKYLITGSLSSMPQSAIVTVRIKTRIDELKAKTKRLNELKRFSLHYRNKYRSIKKYCLIKDNSSPYG